MLQAVSQVSMKYYHHLAILLFH